MLIYCISHSPLSVCLSSVHNITDESHKRKNKFDHDHQNKTMMDCVNSSSTLNEDRNRSNSFDTMTRNGYFECNDGSIDESIILEDDFMCVCPVTMFLDCSSSLY